MSNQPCANLRIYDPLTTDGVQIARPMRLDIERISLTSDPHSVHRVPGRLEWLFLPLTGGAPREARTPDSGLDILLDSEDLDALIAQLQRLRGEVFPS